MIVLSNFGSNVRLNVFDILLYTFTDDLLPDHSVEQDIKLNDYLLEIVLLISLLLSDKESILLLEDVLDLANDM